MFQIGRTNIYGPVVSSKNIIQQLIIPYQKPPNMFDLHIFKSKSSIRQKEIKKVQRNKE